MLERYRPVRWQGRSHRPARGKRNGIPSAENYARREGTVLAITGEIDAWIQAQQFPEGQLNSVESERPTLFRTLKELRSENKELPTENLELQCQLSLERARLSGPKIAC